MKIMVTTYPFGVSDNTPITKLKSIGAEVKYNDLKRKYSRDELIERLTKFQPDIIIAGTEKYDTEILDLIPNLKMISRVGIGLDGVPLEICKFRNITVTYTPDAPSNSVAELAICQMLNALRRVQICDSKMGNGTWDRFIGKELRDCNVGIIGCGRIGSLVISKLEGFKPRKILINDIDKTKCKNVKRTEYASKSEILADCDVISLHIPLTESNYHFISNNDFSLMKKDVILLNTARGGIVNEEDLFKFLNDNQNAIACIDAFETEPYIGDLSLLGNCFVTPHLGSCSKTSRFKMETGSVDNVIDFLNGNRIVDKVI